MGRLLELGGHRQHGGEVSMEEHILGLAGTADSELGGHCSDRGSLPMASAAFSPQPLLPGRQGVTAARWLPPSCHCWTGAATTSSCCPPAPAGLLKHGAGWIPQSAPAFDLCVAAISPLGTSSLDLPPPLSSQYPFPTADPSPEASSASSAESHRTQISRILTSILSLFVSPIKAAPLHSRAGVS